MRFEWPSVTRCCCCLPLRIGVLVFGYLNLLFSLIMAGIYIMLIHDKKTHSVILYHGALSENLPKELSLCIYLLEIIFSVLLLYGAHRKIPVYIKSFFYFTISTLAAAVLLAIVEVSINRRALYFSTEVLVVLFSGLCVQVYLSVLVYSLLAKTERAGPHHYENHLTQVVLGDFETETAATDELA
ncbi:hypothetical protein JYU34_013806 [Plutella xylostella]|uniref:Uncharacterized protein n=1 Tax=Plutella xylostella TaxID=51655 RepID=A0ABQ7QC09_PLUXY|nr:hypothetical protein JYU34_013806 [Plutella xylostella]